MSSRRLAKAGAPGIGVSCMCHVNCAKSREKANKGRKEKIAQITLIQSARTPKMQLIRRAALAQQWL